MTQADLQFIQLFGYVNHNHSELKGPGPWELTVRTCVGKRLVSQAGSTKDKEATGCRKTLSARLQQVPSLEGKVDRT